MILIEATAYITWAFIAVLSLATIRLYFNSKRIKQHQNGNG